MAGRFTGPTERCKGQTPAALEKFEAAANSARLANVHVAICASRRTESESRRDAPGKCDANYAYGVLIGRTQIQLIAEGYDPTIGILHGRESERGMYPAFAFDRMEPMRPVVDHAVLQFVASTTFVAADFSIQPDGVCRLNPEHARRVAKLVWEHCATSGQPLLHGD